MEYMSYKKVFTGGSTFIICLICMWTYVLGKTNFFRIISKIMVGRLQKQKWEILLSEIILKNWLQIQNV